MKLIFFRLPRKSKATKQLLRGLSGQSKQQLHQLMEEFFFPSCSWSFWFFRCAWRRCWWCRRWSCYKAEPLRCLVWEVESFMCAWWCGRRCCWWCMTICHAETITAITCHWSCNRVGTSYLPCIQVDPQLACQLSVVVISLQLLWPSARRRTVIFSGRRPSLLSASSQIFLTATCYLVCGYW